MATTAATKRQQRKLTPPHAGDLIFVRPAADDRVGQLVARATNGPYCHCRIQLSHDMLIEALSRQGVVRSFVQIPPDPADVAAIGASLDVDRLAHALAWLLKQEGHAYNWLACIEDGVEAVLPPALGARTPFLVAPSAYNCSSLACTFAVLAGYKWLPDALACDVTQATPNGLARALGVCK